MRFKEVLYSQKSHFASGWVSTESSKPNGIAMCYLPKVLNTARTRFKTSICSGATNQSTEIKDTSNAPLSQPQKWKISCRCRHPILHVIQPAWALFLTFYRRPELETETKCRKDRQCSLSISSSITRLCRCLALKEDFVTPGAKRQKTHFIYTLTLSTIICLRPSLTTSFKCGERHSKLLEDT